MPGPGPAPVSTAGRTTLIMWIAASLAAGVATIVVTTMTVTTLKIKDSDAAHTITIVTGSESADRNLTIPVLGANRTLLVDDVGNGKFVKASACLSAQ
jgi:hypothetical protein